MGNVVWVNGFASFSSTVGANVRLFDNIPAGYRPSADGYIAGIIYVNSTFIYEKIKITIDGTISQGATGYLSAIIFDGFYTI